MRLLVTWLKYLRELNIKKFYYLVHVILWNKVLTHCELEIAWVDGISIVK